MAIIGHLLATIEKLSGIQLISEYKNKAGNQTLSRITLYTVYITSLDNNAARIIAGDIDLS